MNPKSCLSNELTQCDFFAKKCEKENIVFAFRNVAGALGFAY